MDYFYSNDAKTIWKYLLDFNTGISNSAGLNLFRN